MMSLLAQQVPTFLQRSAGPLFLGGLMLAAVLLIVFFVIAKRVNDFLLRAEIHMDNVENYLLTIIANIRKDDLPKK